LEPFIQPVALNGDGEHTAKRGLARYRERNFSGERRKSGDAKLGFVPLHSSCHGVQGRVEDALLVEQLEEGFERDVLERPIEV